jgi:hypothetical protein
MQLGSPGCAGPGGLSPRTAGTRALTEPATVSHRDTASVRPTIAPATKVIPPDSRPLRRACDGGQVKPG